MAVQKNQVTDFINSLPDKCRQSRDVLVANGQGTWDSRVRKKFAIVLSEWFSTDLNVSFDKVRNYVFVEGWNTIPLDKRGESFFGTKMHPDAAIISREGFSVAIELDHGAKGSQIRNALAKAAFSVLLGKFDRAMLLFFWEEKSPMARPDGLEADDAVLKRFQELFQTTLYII